MRECKRVKIAGIGSYAPERVLTNEYFVERVDTSDGWIVERTGIRERRMAAEGEYTSDLAYHASVRAIEDAGLVEDDIDMVVVGTISPDTVMPSCATIVSKKLGLRNVGAFDLSAACSGFLYALTIGTQFIATGQCRNVLVIGAESLTRLVNYQDRDTCVLFGDGAGAAVLSESNDESEIISTNMFSEEHEDLLTIPAGGCRIPASYESVENRLHFIKMRGREVYKTCVPLFVQMILQELRENNISLDDIKLIIPHQANIRIIQSIARKIELPLDRVYVNIARYGNTSAASVPLAFDEAIRAGAVCRGDYVILVAVGGGLTWSSALIRY